MNKNDRMIFRYTLFILLIGFNLFSQKMEKIAITGIAENAKAGAIVITEDNAVYYPEGILSWSDTILKKLVEVEGYLLIQYQSEETLVNEKGEYKQGLSGEIRKIVKPVWKLVGQFSENDGVLKEIKKILPENWSLKIEKNKLLITCSSPIYVIFENKINAPINIESTEQKQARFKKYGKLVQAQFVFILESRIPDKEIKRMHSENDKISAAINQLRNKLKNIPISHKDGSYRPQNEEEAKLVSDYEKEKAQMEYKIMKLPDYQTEKYALYLESEIGKETDYVSVFPEKISEEMYRIKQEIFGKLMTAIK
jgi:hypothetical protein